MSIKKSIKKPSGQDAFFNKIKNTIYEPLPDPSKRSIFSLQGIILLIVTVGLFCSAVFANYSVFIEGNRSSSGGTSDVEELDDPEPSVKKEDAIFVEIIGGRSFSLSKQVVIEYQLSRDLEEEMDNISSYTTDVRLLDNNGNFVGMIGEYGYSFEKQTIQWNPEVLEREDTFHAPSPGQYRIEVVFRESSVAATDAEHKAETTAFGLFYDTLPGDSEFPFTTCQAISGYSSENWYDNLIASLEDSNISTEDINAMCNSEQGNIVVFIVPGEGNRGYPLIARFNIGENILESAVYTDRRDISPVESDKVQIVEADAQNKQATFGKRNGRIIPILISDNNIFSYDYVDNTFSDNQ